MKFGWFTYIIGIIAFVALMIICKDNDSALFILSWFALFLVWAFSVPFLLIKKAMKKANVSFENIPEQTAKVRVFAKTLDINYGIATHFVSFEFNDGNRKNFQVDVNQYNSVAENETGTITYQEAETHLIFIKFQHRV